MSRIEDLIAKHCPNGVELIELQKLFTTRNGYTPSRKNPEYWENGTIPWFRLADIRGGDRILTEAIENVSPSAVKNSGLFPANTIIISTLATIGEHALMKVPGLCNQQLTALTLREKYAALFNIKFLFYYTFVLADWCKKNTMNSSFASVDMKQFKRFGFPMPPLEVQDEIVRILDSFTELEANLQTELKARSKQYEYYRDSLLRLENLTNRLGKENVKLLPLGQLVVIKNGKDYKHLGAGRIPVYGSGGPMDVFVDTPSYSKPTVLLPRKGSITNIFYLDEPFWNIDTVFYTEIDTSQIIPKFFYHAVSSCHIENFSTGSAARPSLTQTALKKIRIPVPPLAEQERIVAILDKFDALVNDLSSGLPAEIAARRKQYEYYRDQLLTFTPNNSRTANLSRATAS
ncbi:restriction endonuclease subunit S [Varibaculum cambriense]|uniref:restriction endonuclease subunit S n=2 Tax=Varibaculum TaxID=184869 RepID=UPI0028FED861|nr:restriction endonuclease subunit S [Varibaculum cambriense]MDU1224622.1 restriction endonuclease subunit S [Varibaculum cambriense]